MTHIDLAREAFERATRREHPDALTDKRGHLFPPLFPTDAGLAEAGFAYHGTLAEPIETGLVRCTPDRDRLLAQVVDEADLVVTCRLWVGDEEE